MRNPRKDCLALSSNKDAEDGSAIGIDATLAEALNCPEPTLASARASVHRDFYRTRKHQDTLLPQEFDAK